MVTKEEYIRELNKQAYKKAYEKKQLAGQKIKKALVESSKTPKFARNIKPLSKGRVASKQFSATLIRAFGGRTQQTQGKGKVGRPPQMYKNIYNVPAKQYYKILRQQRRLATMRAEQIAMSRQAQIQQQLARQGITPEQAQLMQQQRLQAQIQASNMQPQQIPNQMPQNIQPIQNQQMQRPIWRDTSYVDTEVDIMGNRRQVLRGHEKSFWN